MKLIPQAMRASRRPVIWLLGLLFLSGSLQASLLDSGYRASYQVSRNGMQLGESQRSLRPLPDGSLQLAAQTRPTGLAGLFVSDIIDESSRLELTASGARPSQYRYHQHGGRKDRRYGLQLDWGSDTLTFTHSQQHAPLQAGTQDPLSFLVEIMFRLQHGERDFPLNIAERKKIDTYRLSVIDEAPRKTPLGTQPVLRLRIAKVDSDSYYELWTLPEKDHLPLRLTRHKDDEVLELRLRSFTPFDGSDTMTATNPTQG